MPPRDQLRLMAFLFFGPKAIYKPIPAPDTNEATFFNTLQKELTSVNTPCDASHVFEKCWSASLDIPHKWIIFAALQNPIFFQFLCTCCAEDTTQSQNQRKFAEACNKDAHFIFKAPHPNKHSSLEYTLAFRLTKQLCENYLQPSAHFRETTEEQKFIVLRLLNWLAKTFELVAAQSYLGYCVNEIFIAFCRNTEKLKLDVLINTFNNFEKYANFFLDKKEALPGQRKEALYWWVRIALRYYLCLCLCDDNAFIALTYNKLTFCLKVFQNLILQLNVLAANATEISQEHMTTLCADLDSALQQKQRAASFFPSLSTLITCFETRFHPAYLTRNPAP